MEKIAEVDSAEESEQIVSFAPYDVDGRVQLDPHRLGMAIAHVSAQAGSLADAQIQLQYRQTQQIYQQQQYVENRVEHVRAEVNARNEELAHLVRQTQLNPEQIDNHFSTRIAAAMDEAQREAAVKFSTNMRLRVDLVLKEEATVNSELPTKELLGTYFEHHATQTKAAIAAEADQSTKRIEARLTKFEQLVTMQMDNATKLAEKKARVAVRRHLTHQNVELDALKTSLLKAIADWEEKAVARAGVGAKVLVDELVTKQLADAAMLEMSSADATAALVSLIAPTETLRDTPVFQPWNLTSELSMIYAVTRKWIRRSIIECDLIHGT
ncbi:hypothetical protein V7S43_011198 [Phytophthora oleae]|uniref:Uncharacterized protein n=1 Tax=Phytophthora oleae TaxID=2107226 RepID=A0ABD3FFK7_9STRA